MKKQLLGLGALTIAIVMSAFSLPDKTSDNQMELEWHKYNSAGTAELVPAVTFLGTESEARAQFGCPSPGNKICARGYDDGVPTSNYISKP
ncbi:hypothetical protein KJS94_12410 [Flavihumibacter rivuli]|uniref:hypothetical protein n=1 Tax=Flavihumibacter rivuli TaxID=2838156 RepID=UPI001BDF1298|nr:hypothetical protein [Flavihumibacter rivuli]ULQ55445.1 hypothetical protein KJS94_12410 [Flavihumibacter rivuli]